MDVDSLSLSIAGDTFHPGSAWATKTVNIAIRETVDLLWRATLEERLATVLEKAEQIKAEIAVIDDAAAAAKKARGSGERTTR